MVAAFARHGEGGRLFWGPMGGGIFGIVVVLLFWWAVVVGFKTLFRRFTSTLLGLGGAKEWSLSDYRPVDDRDDYAPRALPAPGYSKAGYNQAPDIEPLHSVTRQMEQTLGETRTTAEELDRRIANWRQSLSSCEVAMIDWSNRAQVAIDGGREDLARQAIAERQRAAAKAAEIRADLTQIETLRTNYGRDIEALETKLSDTWRREVVIQSRMEVAQTSLKARELVYGERTKDALSRLEILEQEATLAEGRADAATLGQGGSGHSLDDQFAALERDAELTRRRGFGRKVD